MQKSDMESHNSMMSIPSSEIAPTNELSFRRTLLFYLKTNANPRLLLKIMQISRYFCFKEFPFHVVEDLRYDFNNWTYFKPGNLRRESQTLDVKNLKKPLWICNELYLNKIGESNLLSKIAVCDVKKLYITRQQLKINEFQVLISSNAVEVVTFRATRIVYDDGNIVPIDEIVKMLPNLKKFSWESYNDESCIKFTPTSTAKLIEYLNPPVLSHFEICGIPENFDFKLFTEFMNQNPSISFSLHFYVQLADDYVNVLQAYVDKLIKNNKYKNRKILVNFPGLKPEVYDILWKHIHYC